MFNKIKYLYLLAMLHVLSWPVQANLAEQLPKVKDYLKNVEHPRLILGVANTDELNYYFRSGKPFIDNPKDILANMEHDKTVLPGRTLTFDFNDIDALKQVAEALPNAFGVITIDFSSIKFARWDEEHFAYFAKMLKPGGTIIFPLDGSSAHLFYTPVELKADLFEQALQTIKQDPRLDLHVPHIYAIPNEISNIAVDLGEIEAYLRQLKTLPANLFGTTPEETEDNISTISDFAQSKGIPDDMLHILTKNILQNDDELRKFAKDSLIGRKKNELRNELADEFYQKHVIPLLIQRLQTIFPKGEITIKKSTPMPAPHRQEYDGYSLAITKAIE